MQLKVEVNTSAQLTTFRCHGKIIGGNESDYLFDLLTRPENRDIMLDLEQVHEFDHYGLLTIKLCREYLASAGRGFCLRGSPAMPISAAVASRSSSMENGCYR
jgi:hypothetical protein